VDVSLVRSAEGQATVRFGVQDSGPGIPKDRMGSLFRLFSQADSSSTRKFGGTGLGLAIAKRLCEMMGGEIGVETELGKGSTFWFTACFAAIRGGESPCAGPQALADGRTLNILAVDDNAVNRDILCVQVGSWGFAVQTAGSGEEALHMLYAASGAGRPFDLVILDNHMPGMSGLDVARTIKASAKLKSAALILLTSMSDQPSGWAKKSEFVAMLTKPVRQSELLNAVLSVFPSAAVTPLTVGADAAQAPVISPSGNRLRSAGLKILLAEDNEINQEVAREILRTAGAGCDIAANGKLALEALQRERYDAVLMDCQMPEMDGFTAAREIRKLEAQGQVLARNGKRLPIIALTANAIKGDRELCLDAGMDEYVSKPVSPDQLIAAIHSVLSEEPPSPRGQAAQDSAAPSPAAAPSGVPSPAGSAGADPGAPVNMAEVLSRCAGNQGFVDQLLVKFVDKVRKDLRELEEHVASANAQKVAFVAHGLKGAAANLSAEGLRQAASDLEQAGKAADFSRVETCLAAVRGEVRRCVAYLVKAPPRADDKSEETRVTTGSDREVTT
jgi:CheY-like chemotaxis protein/HPt (histidine-containing phosphotransfer) domain-containing protein